MSIGWHQLMATIGSVLASFGDSWEVPDESFDELEAVICGMYGRPRFSKSRLYVIMDKSGVDERLKPSCSVDNILPPCRTSLEQHMKRVNYQVDIRKIAHTVFYVIHAPTYRHGLGYK
ncbi:hypothetical protein CHS0354_024206 [Potamilus streckersoni]|uniref:Uncharacterized protein n=1 Tax=Potamilus streckersoni TaxID=2493646 RepID=A0AAE0VKR6_9BIVA|nr:hypothetical protein CHS0354_024206 [Potamilus streckersoni]